jgi:hypothetical protein
MKKWKSFASISARRRRSISPDRHYELFQQTLQKIQRRCCKNDSIRSYCWTVKYADIPQLTFIILLHRAATTACTTAVANALEEAFEDIAVTAVVVTFSRKAFLRIARGHLLP